jgi:hypothetical protein
MPELMKRVLSAPTMAFDKKFDKHFMKSRLEIKVMSDWSAQEVAMV